MKKIILFLMVSVYCYSEDIYEKEISIDKINVQDNGIIQIRKLIKIKKNGEYIANLYDTNIIIPDIRIDELKYELEEHKGKLKDIDITKTIKLINSANNVYEK
jgi:hypothetical protein